MNSDRNPGVLGESLPPVLGPVENGKRTLKILDNIDFDLMGYLLSCHLIVEHYIDEFLHAHYPDLDWDAARLTFEKRVALLSKWGLGHDPIPEIKHLNTLRNRLSHHVDYALSSEDFLPFVRYLQRVSNGAIQRTEPKAVLHLFTLSACDSLLNEIHRMNGN
jgi:hypothetical protein